jgi:hypothetical protein
MRTGGNMSHVLPTTNARPMGSEVGSLGAGVAHRAAGQMGVPVTPTLMAGMGQQGRAVQTGGGGAGGGELVDAARRLSRSAGMLDDAARRTSGDVVELADNWSPQPMRNLLQPDDGEGVQGVPSIISALPDAPGIAQNTSTSRGVEVGLGGRALGGLLRWRIGLM